MASKQPLIIEVLRGPVVESVHQVMAVVVNEIGSVTHFWGNPQFLTVPRSAIKMLQAIPFIESGAVEKWNLEDKHIALACSSHGGEKEHLQVVAQWFEKMQLKESCLACGPHLPFHEGTAKEMIHRGQSPTPFCNNCSGKHAALLATSLHLGEDIAGYEKYEHPSQKRMRKVLSEVMHVDHSKMAYGIDGCGLPTYAVPLQSMAVGMASLINPRESSERRAVAGRILRAVKAYPFFLAGSDNFVTDVIEKSQGRALIKGGAEGVFCGVLPEKRLAFAIKALDGAGRAAQVATASLLFQFGGLSETEFKALHRHTQPILTNWKGEAVGQIRIAKAT
ncbi:MAG: asparaginase [Bdellovibrio sp.]